MVKNSFIAIISHKENKENRGSIEFQVFSFTTKIRTLISHLELHRKYSSSHRGFRKFLGKRQRLMTNLSKRDIGRYKELIGELDIQEIKTL